MAQILLSRLVALLFSIWSSTTIAHSLRWSDWRVFFLATTICWAATTVASIYFPWTKKEHNV